MYTILDCYTDEPAGLGVPPYLGTYPRYIYGYLVSKGYLPNYVTIDDLRAIKYGMKKGGQKTEIKTYNTTAPLEKIKEILAKTKTLIIIAGVHTPGKYLSAHPGTLKEISSLVLDINCRKILTGPAVYGTSLYGGKFSERVDLKGIKVEGFDFNYKEIADYSLHGAQIIKHIPDLRVIEIETSRGCSYKRCSFCTEPLKYKHMEFREKNDVLKEILAFYNLGVKYFRLGKQSCFYTYPNAVDLIREIRKKFPRIEVLHIDNVNPVTVLSKKGIEITKAIVKYCTPGNIAAFGVESFDAEVVKQNYLNCTPNRAFEAVKLLNKYGSVAGENGMPKFLPGINLIFGLKGESKRTFEENYKWLKKILNAGLFLRRINIRQVSIFENTLLHKECGNKFIKKNKRYYWSARNKIRQEIDFPMLKRLVPIGSVLKDVRMEIYDGGTTFGRQIGTYPLIIGVKGRRALKQFFDVKITGHMLRSIIGEIV